jgi:NAD+ synthase (glutamine-hydrolysing)
MRIGLAQLNYKIGDFERNYHKIETAIKTNAAQCDIIVFSELCLSGYYPKDLIMQPGFFETQQNVLEKIKALSVTYEVDLIIGLITKSEIAGKPFHNSLAWISKGNVTYTYHKQLLPVYNIFNEARHFSPGKTLGLFTFQDQRIGFLICEDGWAGIDDYTYECDPDKSLSTEKLDLIISINGSPSNIGKQQTRLSRFESVAKMCKSPLLFVNQIGGNDDIVFDGASFALDREGKCLGLLPAFSEAFGIINIESDITLSPSFAQSSPLSSCALFYQQTILGLKDYADKCGFKSVVVGASGGMDSALTLALAVQALGKDNVTAMAMPSRYSSKESLEDATLLCEQLGIKLIEYSIEEEFQIALQRFSEVFKTPPQSITEQNIQARLRGRLLMEYSNQTGALVLSTGNKSELSVGYTTLYGDMTGGFNLIGDLYKTDVYEVARYYNQQHPDLPIPEVIFKKAPSAELAPNQKDSDTLPDYAILDPILKLYIEGDLLPRAEKETYQKLLESLSPSFIEKVHGMVDKAEFKRRQSAPIVRVQRRAFGYGRQFPIAACYPRS